MDKKGVELSFETIAILILILLVLVILILTYGSQFSKLFAALGGFFD